VGRADWSPEQRVKNSLRDIPAFLPFGGVDQTTLFDGNCYTLRIEKKISLKVLFFLLLLADPCTPKNFFFVL